MSKGYRTFNGKLYEKEITVWSKREAQETARKLRGRGFLARIVKGDSKDRFAATGEGWIVYVRRAKR